MLCRQIAARSLWAAALQQAARIAGAGACQPEAHLTQPVTPTGGSRAAHSSRGGGRQDVHSTTVLCVRKDGQVVLVADGQVTMGGTVVKPNVRKTRKIGESAIGGFAGATADAFTLFERLEHKLEEHSGQLTRASVELAKMWRTDKFLRRLDAALIVADRHQSLQITGNGDVLEPHDGIIAIGSGSPFALAAARALIDQPGLDALAVARKAMTIAAESCIYTNTNFTTLRIDGEGQIGEVDLSAAGAGGGGGGGAAGSSGEGGGAASSDGLWA